MKKNAFDVRHPWFRPLWSRVALTAFSLGWAAVEFFTGSMFWGILFGASGLYLAHQFFVVFDPADYEKRKDE